MRTFEGGCHCGRVRFRMIAEVNWVVDCGCSICTMKGFLHIVVPSDQFELLSGRNELGIYEFGTRAAKHFFCRHCGIHPFYLWNSDPSEIDVNARCLDGLDVRGLHTRLCDGVNRTTPARRNLS